MRSLWGSESPFVTPPLAHYFNNEAQPLWPGFVVVRAGRL